MSENAFSEDVQPLLPDIRADRSSGNEYRGRKETKLSGNFWNRHPRLTRIMAAGVSVGVVTFPSVFESISAQQSGQEQKVESGISAIVKENDSLIKTLYGERLKTHRTAGIRKQTATEGYIGQGERVIGTDVIIDGPEEPTGGVGTFDFHTADNSKTGEITEVLLTGIIQDSHPKDLASISPKAAEAYIGIVKDNGVWKLVTAKHGGQGEIGNSNIIPLDQIYTGNLGDPTTIISNLNTNLNNIITSAFAGSSVSSGFRS